MKNGTTVFGFLTILALAVPAGLHPLPGHAEVTVRQVERASTAQGILDLGARKLTAAQFKARVVDKPMAGDGWNWIIESNGTTSSEALDGSWKEVNQTWSMNGDKYCTPIEGKNACRDVYMIGGYIRMSDKEDDNALSNWTAKLK